MTIEEAIKLKGGDLIVLGEVIPDDHCQEVAEAKGKILTVDYFNDKPDKKVVYGLLSKS